MALAGASDLLELFPMGGDPPNRYIARFRCKGLMRSETGDVVEADHFEVGIWFPSDYLRRAEPFQVLTWLGPGGVFHPNISDKAPFICVGRLKPNTPLTDIIYQCFEIITYSKVTMREDDALNTDAWVWARENQHKFPIDRRPLKRRALSLLLLATGALVKLARPSVEENEDQIAVRFEVGFTTAPAAAELAHALSALSVACAMSGREARALQDETIARNYLAMIGAEKLGREQGKEPSKELGKELGKEHGVQALACSSLFGEATTG